jgi:hypothetical protein
MILFAHFIVKVIKPTVDHLLEFVFYGTTNVRLILADEKMPCVGMNSMSPTYQSSNLISFPEGAGCFWWSRRTTANRNKTLNR